MQVAKAKFRPTFRGLSLFGPRLRWNELPSFLWVPRAGFLYPRPGHDRRLKLCPGRCISVWRSSPEPRDSVATVRCMLDKFELVRTRLLSATSSWL